VYDVRQTARFRTWLLRVRDPSLKREHAGPGYRVYYTIRFGTRVLLIGGGDKNSQSRDIEIARSVIADLENDG
jgi:putative component of toxin-antitoxin plasmid stabilization module